MRQKQMNQQAMIANNLAGMFFLSVELVSDQDCAENPREKIDLLQE